MNGKDSFFGILVLFSGTGYIMDKKDIEKLLREENTLSFISKFRTQFSVTITEFYFFRTFFAALESVGIKGDTVKYSRMVNNGIKTDHCIILNKGSINYLEAVYDREKLLQELKRYNNSFEDTGMLESANALVDIFISLL